MTDGLAPLTGSLFDFCQLTAGHIPEIGVLQVILDPVDEIWKQRELKVSRPVQLFLRQIPLTAQAEILAVKPLGGLHHRDAMLGVILFRNGNIYAASFIISCVFHQPPDLAAQVAGDRDAFFDHGSILLFFVTTAGRSGYISYSVLCP
jgi:hypothetical protein